MSGSATAPGRSARSAAVLISSPAISRMRSFIRDLRRCQASPPSRSSATPSLSAAVAREDVDILDRHVELVAAGIGRARRNRAAPAADRDLGQPLIAADAVIDMDDEIAGRERGELGEEGVGALAALAAADEPVAEHVLLGEQRDVGGGEAVVEREDDRARRPGRRRRAPPASSRPCARPSAHDRRAGPSAARARRSNSWRARPCCFARRSVGDMVDDRFVDVGALRPLRREIARRRRRRSRCTVALSGSWNGVTQVERPRRRRAPSHSSRVR